LLKLSGEVLAGEQGYGIDPDVLAQLAEEVKGVVGLGVRMAIVIGGGNIFRGIAASTGGMDRATLATFSDRSSTITAPSSGLSG